MDAGHHPRPGGPPPEAVLFDLDGTLADTFVDLKRALDAALTARGLPAGEHAAVRQRVSEGARAMTRAALAQRACEGPLLESVCEDFLHRYHQDVARGTRLFDGMEQVLMRLEARGVAMGVVTNKAARLTEPLIDALGLRARLRAVVSGDSAARPKPYPDPLLMALDMLGARAGRALFVGDARNDVLAARAAGVTVVAARYGYLAPGEDPAQWSADGVVDTPLGLLAWLGD
jgi:phosphoglycolate phosphatase